MARKAQAPILAWVDPQHPSNAVVDRESYDDPGNFVIAGVALAAFVRGRLLFRAALPEPARKTVRRLNRSW
ncbi:hypothetical protein [Duganella sp. Root336D2]|uniref:hypothetical protein n=1 Tax=Duganella sp. Root336D2 TaxID=1736518 RepID=UPI0012E39A0B|nr:hypothetical protein [Duganella sp. Root336D2]